MKPARQKRLGVALAFVVFLGAAAVPAAPAPPQGRGLPPLSAARRVDKKKEARKHPPLLVVADWKAALPSPPAALPAYDATQAYIPLRSGKLAAAAVADGKINWVIDVLTAPGPPGEEPPVKDWTAPAAGNGLVFVAGPERLEAREAATGQPRWRLPLDARLCAPLYWENGWLLAADERGRATMLRAQTGEVLWQVPLGANARRGAAMAGDRLYVPLEDGRVVALTLATGRLIWQHQLPGRPGAMTPLDGRVFVGADDKFFYCLAARDGRMKWRWRSGGTEVGTPVVDEDNVYFLSMDNALRALDRGDGHQVWQVTVPMRPASGPFLTGGLLLVAGVATEIRAYQAVDGSEAGIAEIAGDLAAPPHFLSRSGDEVSSFIIVTGEGQLVQYARALASKPFPPQPIYPLWPGAAGQEKGKDADKGDGDK